MISGLKDYFDFLKDIFQEICEGIEFEEFDEFQFWKCQFRLQWSIMPVNSPVLNSSRRWRELGNVKKWMDEVSFSAKAQQKFFCKFLYILLKTEKPIEIENLYRKKNRKISFLNS